MAALSMRSCHLLSLLILVLAAGCHGRPQHPPDEASVVEASVKEGRLHSVETAFFSPHSWQPISHDTGIVIDETPTRVRIESPQRDGRASSDSYPPPPPPTFNLTANQTTRGKSPSPLGDAIKMVASQLLQSRGSVDEADVRAPPKQHKTQSAKKEEASESSHGGVAIPVLLDEDMDKVSTVKETTTKKTATTLKKTPTTEPEKKTTTFHTTKKTQYTRTTPTTRNPVTSIPDGLTTWVYLSGSSPSSLRVSTDAPTTRTTVESTTKKVLKPVTLANFAKKPSPLFTSSGTKPLPNRFTRKPSEEVNVTKSSAEILEEVKEKVTKKPEAVTEISFRRRPVTIEAEVSSYKPLPTAYPVSTRTTEEVTEPSTDVETETTSKRPITKKKNKKRRRRPAKKPADSVAVESKVEEDTKLKAPKQKPKPMGTRIYNYLAREVMPSVGVGLIGLVGLAGLAGLILYPFGGGGVGLPIRRNYEETPKPNYYNYYNSNERTGNGQTEEEVLGKVIAGMKDTSYVTGEQYPDVSSRTPEDKYTRFSVENSGDYTRYNTEGKEGDSYLSYNVDQNSGEQYNKRYPSNTRAEVQSEDYTRYDAGGRINTHETKPIAYETDVKAKTNDGYASRTEPRPVYLSNDWGVVKTEAPAVETEPKPQAMMYRGEEEPIYGQQEGRPQYSGVSRVGVGQRRNTAVEHGPRRLRRETIKKDSVVNEADNEIELGDPERVTEEVTTTALPKSDTTISEEATVQPTTYQPDTTTRHVEEITIEPESPDDPTLVGLIRRVAQFKIRLGLSFLRNTSQAFTRYLDGMQRRVGEMVNTSARYPFGHPQQQQQQPNYY